MLNVPPDVWLMLVSVGSGHGGSVVVDVVLVVDVVEVVLVVLVVEVLVLVEVVLVDVVLVVVVVVSLQSPLEFTLPWKSLILAHCPDVLCAYQ